jgi:transposase InsO family protein
MRISGEIRDKVVELDRRYRSSWDCRSIAHVTGVGHTTVARILKLVRGGRPKPGRPAHTRRTRFLFRDVMWSSDFVELPGKRWLLKTMDETSRFRLGWDVVKAQTAEAVERHASDILARMGRAPLVWKFDHGSQFTGELFQSVLEEHDIIPFPTPPRAPWANGRVERDHQEIQSWLIPWEGKTMVDAGLERDTDEGMFMLNFIKPRMVLDYQTSARAYFTAEGVEKIDREWLALDLEDLKCRLGPAGGERLHRRAVRRLLQKWELYQEWDSIPKRATTVNTSNPNDVSF